MTENNNTQADGDRGRRRTRIFLMSGIIGAFVLALAAYGLWWALDGRYYVSTDDAYVTGNRLMLTPQIAGTIVSIYANDTDRVHAGQPVIVLDHSNEEVALQQAEAQLGQSVRAVLALSRQEAVERATIAQRRVALELARRDYDRDRHLLKINAVTDRQYQHSQAEYANAKSALAEAVNALAVLQARVQGTGVRANPDVQLAIARVRKAYLNLQRTRIPAPANGYVAQRSAQIGERVSPGDPLLAIVPLSQVWVEANFKETQLDRVRIGQPVRLTADLYGSSVVYHGKVSGISAGTGSAFELLPPQNATGNWIKLVRRVPVRVDIPARELKEHPLRIGLSMNVSIDVHDTRGQVLATTPQTHPVYRTTVYKEDKTGFENIVNRILAANGAGSSPTPDSP